MRAPGSDAAAYIAAWQPSSVSPQAAAFARAAVTAAAPDGRDRAKNLLWAAAKLADWAIRLGMDPVPEWPACPQHPSPPRRWTRRCAMDVLPGCAGKAAR